jgi:hypothetical protein
VGGREGRVCIGGREGGVLTRGAGGGDEAELGCGYALRVTHNSDTNHFIRESRTCVV